MKDDVGRQYNIRNFESSRRFFAWLKAKIKAIEFKLMFLNEDTAILYRISSKPIEIQHWMGY
jgi:hypothetical protein